MHKYLELEYHAVNCQPNKRDIGVVRCSGWDTLVATPNVRTWDDRFGAQTPNSRDMLAPGVLPQIPTVGYRCTRVSETAKHRVGDISRLLLVDRCDTLFAAGAWMAKEGLGSTGARRGVVVPFTVV